MQIENFDSGGNGAAYLDNDNSALNTVYRTGDRVPLQSCVTPCDGYSSRTLAVGEWMQYNVFVQGGTYSVAVIAASGVTGACHLEFDARVATPRMTLQNSGATWVETEHTTLVQIDRGYHTIRVVVDGAGASFDYVRFATRTPAAGQHVLVVIALTGAKRQAGAAGMSYALFLIKSNLFSIARSFLPASVIKSVLIT